MTSSARISDKSWRRDEDRISSEAIRLRFLQWSPYGAQARLVKLQPMCLPTIREGRLAKTMSFLVKHSSAADGDETTSIRREPNWRRRVGPCRFDKLDSDL